MIEIAKLTQFNEKAEAQAIFDYTEMIRVISESEIDEELKDELNAKIAELIADELNHQKSFTRNICRTYFNRTKSRLKFQQSSLYAKCCLYKK